MGLISSLVDQEFKGKREEKQLQIEALSHIMQSDMAPEKKSEYTKEALKKIGMKGQNYEIFHRLLAQVGQADAQGKAKNKDYGMSSAAGGAGELSQSKPAAKHGKQKGGDNWYDSDKSLFPSAEEERAAARQNQEEKDERAYALYRREKDLELEMAGKKAAAANELADKTLDSMVSSGLITHDQYLKYKVEQKRIQAGLSQDEQKPPATPAAEMKPHVIRKADGTEVTAFETGPGKYQTPDGKPVELTAQDKIDPKDSPTPPLSQEVRDQEAYYKSTGMGDEEAKKMALKERHHELATKEKGAEIRVITGAQNIENGKPLPEGHYTPGALSVANPTGNMTIDVGAWDYITTGHLPFTGFSGGGKGKANAREKMLARAGELLADLGLSPADLPAVRGSVKADMGALSKVTSMGAMIGQFETTLEKNMKVAEKLSSDFKRGDVRLYNRVLSAFKTGKGDPEALNLAAQLHGVAREWGKIMQGSVSASGVQVSEANAADAFFGQGMSNGQLHSFFLNVIVPDMKNRSEAIQDQKDKLVGNLRKVVQDVKGGGQQAPAGPPIGTVVNGYEFKGGDPNQQSSWKKK